jgi:hypothetical protein
MRHWLLLWLSAAGTSLAPFRMEDPWAGCKNRRGPRWNRVIRGRFVDPRADDAPVEFIPPFITIWTSGFYEPAATS